MIVVMPTVSGSSVARPRKNRIDSTSRNGNAISSARPRSAETFSPICVSATAPPPTITSRSPAKASSACAATSSSSAVELSFAVTSAERPSSATAAGPVALTTPSKPATSSVTAAIRAFEASAPSGVLTTSASPVPAWRPLASASSCTARSDSASLGTNPPEEESSPATGPPMAPATTTNTSTISRVRRGRPPAVLASRVSMRRIVARASRRHIGPREALPAPRRPRGVHRGE